MEGETGAWGEGAEEEEGDGDEEAIVIYNDFDLFDMPNLPGWLNRWHKSLLLHQIKSKTS